MNPSKMLTRSFAKRAALTLLSCLALAATVTGCDAFLEEETYTFLTKKTFYKTEADAIAAVNAVYHTLHTTAVYRGGIFQLVDFPSLQSTDNKEGGDLDLLTWDATNNTVFSFWQISYQGVNYANIAIKRIPSIRMEEDLKKRLIGEARFLRAFLYFNLIKLFGNIPVVTEPTTSLDNLNSSNADTHDKVWNLIIEDLQYAEGVLPATYSATNTGRATRGAAKALLAKVYLQRSGLAKYAPDPSLWGVEGVNEWQQALNKAQEVIDSGAYALFEDYSHVFDANTENGKEHIFSIQFLAGLGKPEGMANVVKMTGVRGAGRQHPYGGRSDWTGTPAFFNMWDKSDDRFPWTWVLEFEFNGEIERYPGSDLMQNPYIYKYRIRPAEKERLERFSGSVPVIRYADVLLMHAEAANETGTADPYFGINKVRERAGLEPLSGLSQRELREAIFRERAFELCFEAKAFFDYQRFGVLEERASMQPGVARVEPFRYVYPIPQEAMDRNLNLKQNPGY